MDQRKNLKPELKEIYERVMNTPTGAARSTTTSAPTSTPQPAQPTTQPKPNPLASVPPRQLDTPPGKEFIFSAKNQPQDEKHEQHNTHHATHTAAIRDPFFNGKVLLLSVIFVLVWTMFWLVLLGVVKPTSFGL